MPKTKKNTRAELPALEMHVHPKLIQIVDGSELPVANITARTDADFKTVARLLAPAFKTRKFKAYEFDAHGSQL